MSSLLLRRLLGDAGNETTDSPCQDDGACVFSPPPLVDVRGPPIGVEVPFTMTIAPSHKTQHLTFIALSVASALALVFLLITYYFVILHLKSYLRRRRLVSVTVPLDPPDPHTPPTIDPNEVHHVWLIRTVGLDQTTIDSIATYPFKPGDGLVDATDCTVCLAEFRDGELLRLLPKCTHAFHVQCIDTWLRAHVNCPLCRAPVVHGAAQEEETESGPPPVPGDQPVLVSDGEDQNGSVPDLGSSAASSSSSSSSSSPLSGGNGTEENWVSIDLNDGGPQQIVRRSASMDANALRSLMEMDVEAHAVAMAKDVGGGVGIGSEQKGPDGVGRCQSTNGRRFFLPRFARGRSASVLPL